MLAAFIVAWDVVEGIVAVTAGLAAGSIALVDFGVDSAIEVFAATLVIWQLRGVALLAVGSGRDAWSEARYAAS